MKFVAFNGNARAQRGAATLIVVMLIFFVMSLVAAYASRNLIFEQRTSVNQYRATQVHEAAEAGIEWALAMLHSGRIDGNCQPTADTSQTTFRNRYLLTNSSTGVLSRQIHSNGNTASNLWAACSFDNGAWTCRCPTGDLAATDLPPGRAAFAVRFVNQLNAPGMVRIEANGCSSYDLACLRFVEPSLTTTFCRSTACAMLAVFNGLKSTPSAAVTSVQGISGSSLSIYNQSVEAGGVTIHSGGGNSLLSAQLFGLPGTPSAQTVRLNDPTLTAPALAADSADCTQCLFAATFGLRPSTYRRQLGTLIVDCSATCDAADVNDALATARSRVVWLRGAGGLTLGTSGDLIGSSSSPVVLISEGPVVLSTGAGSATRISGLVYASSAEVSAGEIRGALISATTVVGNGSGKVVFDPAILNSLRLTTGSLARVPGSWRDFP